MHCTHRISKPLRLDPCYVLKRREWCAFPSESLCRNINTCERSCENPFKTDVHEPLLPKQRECYLQQENIIWAFWAHLSFVELDEHLFDGEVYAINHFVKLLKNIIICFLKIRAKDITQYSLKHHSERIELKTLSRKYWSSSQNYRCSSFANTNKFRHLLRNNRYPFKWRT